MGYSASQVVSGSSVGLGTGSYSYWFAKEIRYSDTWGLECTITKVLGSVQKHSAEYGEETVITSTNKQEFPNKGLVGNFYYTSSGLV